MNSPASSKSVTYLPRRGGHRGWKPIVFNEPARVPPGTNLLSAHRGPFLLRPPPEAFPFVLHLNGPRMASRPPPPHSLSSLTQPEKDRKNTRTKTSFQKLRQGSLILPVFLFTHLRYSMEQAVPAIIRENNSASLGETITCSTNSLKTHTLSQMFF